MKSCASHSLLAEIASGLEFDRYLLLQCQIRNLIDGSGLLDHSRDHSGISSYPVMHTKYVRVSVSVFVCVCRVNMCFSACFCVFLCVYVCGFVGLCA